MLKSIISKLGCSIFAVAAFTGLANAGEQKLEFKFVTMQLESKDLEAPGMKDRLLYASKMFGVAFFKDGRIATKDFIDQGDLLAGAGPIHGYSTYTFEDGSTISASYTAELKDSVKGTYTILSGTGIYDKATGTGSFETLPAKYTDGANLYTGVFNVVTP